jgi:hypothetical protein
MRKTRVYWGLCGSVLLVAVSLLASMWKRDLAALRTDGDAPFWDIKEDQRRVHKRVFAAIPPGPQKVRAKAKLPDGWRELPIDKAVVHIVKSRETHEPILCTDYGGFYRYLEVTFGSFDWIIDLPILEKFRDSNKRWLMKTRFGIDPYGYFWKKRDVVFGIGDLEVRLVDEEAMDLRRVNGAILPEEAARVILVPMDATIGKPHKPSNQDARINRILLARWFRDACIRQRRNHVPQVTACLPFCIFSCLYRGSAALSDKDWAYVNVKSLRIHGNQIVLKIDICNPCLTTRPQYSGVPLVEVPIRAALPAGRYSVRVDWGGYDEDENEYPRGSHDIFFDVVK